MPNEILDELMALSFEDRIAQYVLAILYTSDHIDVSFQVPVPEGKKESKKKEDARRLSTLRSNVYTAHRGYSAPARGGPVYKQSIIYRVNSKDVSEIDYDCIAVVIIGRNMYISRNYKQRKMAVTPTKLKETPEYEFSTWANEQMRAVVRGLGQSLASSRGDTQINHVTFVAPTEAPENEKASAAPHAEMQLVSYLKGVSQRTTRSRFGVSKGCCAKCAPELDERQIIYTKGRKQNAAPANWLEPDEIEMSRVARHSVGWRFSRLGLRWA
jgi:hypothetical protein